MRGALAVLAALASGAAGAGIITYRQANTDPCPTARCEALGYPVPQPVDSQIPVDGFRSYAALQARLQDLAATSDSMGPRTIGTTLAGRPILAYVLGDADALTPEGFAEPAMLQNGGIHAREWAAPEVVAGIAERLMQNQADHGFHQYLLEAATVVLVPSLNVDGFLQTQRFPSTALQTTFTGPEGDAVHSDPPTWPRDGRMRRKNMHCTASPGISCPVSGQVDEQLSTENDGMLGVDNNRNNSPFFDSGVHNSDDTRSLVYHGEVQDSEAENEALAQAAALGPAARLRYYVDTHSFSRMYLGLDTGNQRRDAMTRALHATLNAVTANRYPYDATPAGTGIGSTDEHFGYGLQIPSYTLELEPRNGSAEYGGFGAEHDGFILPDSQIARVRAEIAASALIGMYRMAGPPAIAAVEIRDQGAGTAVFTAHWQRRDEQSRQLVVVMRAPLQTERDYVLWLAFDKPMRLRNGGGAVAPFCGPGGGCQAIALAPALALEGIDANGARFSQAIAAPASGWRAAPGAAPNGFRRYADDAYAVSFRVPAGSPLASARRLALSVEVQDLAGQRLDANPATAADLAGGGWARYEDGAGSDQTDTGGADQSLRLVDDGSPLFPPPAPAGNFGGSGGALPPAALGVLLALALRRRRITFPASAERS
ncbi:MAG TPA: M14 family zinc carboxypeptidase [Solimonas sp.]|nr:M14 family zinc carboxypeptidase [Solimonas sp.]